MLRLRCKQARFRAELEIAEIEFKKIIEVKDFDLGMAVAAVRKTAAIETASDIETVKNMKAMRSFLTDQQFAEIKKIVERTSDKTRRREN